MNGSTTAAIKNFAIQNEIEWLRAMGIMYKNIIIDYTSFQRRCTLNIYGT